MQSNVKDFKALLFLMAIELTETGSNKCLTMTELGSYFTEVYNFA